MTTIEIFLALADRCEMVKWPNAEIDRSIAKLMGWHRVEPRFTRNKHGAWISPEDFIGTEGNGSPKLDSLHGTTMHREVPRYTASIDAAKTMVPDGCFLRFYGEYPRAIIVRWHDGAYQEVSRASGLNDALVIAAASLRARASLIGATA